MKPVLMREKHDCEVAAIATATEKTYDEAKKALSWRDLPGRVENPIYGNPWNLYLALMHLGFWKRNITLADLLNNNATPMKTVVLVHDAKTPIINQHWIIWGGITAAGNHMLFWGDSIKPRLKSAEQFSLLFHNGFPNCAFEVYKANVFKIWLGKIKIIINNCIKTIKSWYYS